MESANSTSPGECVIVSPYVLGVDAEARKLPRHHPAQATGVSAYFVMMAVSVALSYLWSIAHAVFTGFMIVAFLAHLLAWRSDKSRFPVSSFILLKMPSCILGNVLLLFMRWNVGAFGDNGTRFPTSTGPDPPGPFNFTAWVVVIVVLNLNILEAVVDEWRLRITRPNSILGLTLILTLPAQPVWGEICHSWIIAYTIWNCIFVVRKLGTRVGFAYCGHNIIPFLASMMFAVPPNMWLYFRGVALGMFLSFQFARAWLVPEGPWRDRIYGPCEANRTEVLPDAITWPTVATGFVCVGLSWVPGCFCG